MEQHSMGSNSDTNSDSGSQSPKSNPNADPDAVPSDPAVELREELLTQLCLEGAESKDEQPSPAEEEVNEEELEQCSKEDEDRDSTGWNQVDDFNIGESNGVEKEEENQSYDIDKFGDGAEKGDGISNGYESHVYPVRPEAEDCSFYMKTGNCKFGSNCKFNHPVSRKTQGSKERVKDKEEKIEMPNHTERPNQTECKYYMRTGGCKYGKACRYNHSKAKSPSYPPNKTTICPVSDLNFLGLPIRPGERECQYYMRNGSCKFGANCRFNHPDPTAVGGSDPPLAFSNGSPASLQSNDTPFMPVMYSPTQGLPSPSSEWNGYQAPVYPPESVLPHVQFHRSPATDNNAYPRQQKMSAEEFPERPGQPECSFYMKTGDCKFKFTCKYHHPKNRNSASPPCILSDKGLPLRPGKNICSYYSGYGICKYGPACRFDHPPRSTPSAEFEDTPYGEEEGRMADTGNWNDTAIHQSAHMSFREQSSALSKS